MNEEQARAELFRQSKKANQRMLRLERAFGSDVTDIGAVKRLMPLASSETESGQTKIRFKKPTQKMSYQQVLRELKKTNNFLSANTSTVGGYKKVVDSHKKASAMAMIPSDVLDNLLTKVISENDGKTTKQLHKLYESEKNKLVKEIMSKVDFNNMYKRMNEEMDRVQREYGDLTYYDSKEILEEFYNNAMRRTERVGI